MLEPIGMLGWYLAPGTLRCMPITSARHDSTPRKARHVTPS